VANFGHHFPYAYPNQQHQGVFPVHFDIEDSSELNVTKIYEEQCRIIGTNPHTCHL
jgi:hypothetical protein